VNLHQMFRVACMLAMLLCSIPACSTPSINPIYSPDESEVVIDDRLVGLWGSDDPKKDGTRYRVLANEHAADPKLADHPPKSYRLTVESEGGAKKHAAFELRLIRLGATDFIDCVPAASETRTLGDRYGLAAIPTHIIMPIAMKDNHATIRPLDLGKIHQLLTEAPNMTPHVIRDRDVIILTGSTRQVQEFFRKITGDDHVFAEPIELIRLKDEPLPNPPDDAGMKPREKVKPNTPRGRTRQPH